MATLVAADPKYQHTSAMERFFYFKQKAFFKGAPAALRRARRRCGRQGRGISPCYPALSRSVTRDSRDGASRTGLRCSAPQSGAGSMRPQRFESLKHTALGLTVNEFATSATKS